MFAGGDGSWALGRVPLYILLFIGVLFGSPALDIIFGWTMGTHTIVVDSGRVGEYTAIRGPAAPLPAWVPVLPGATISDATQVLSGSLDGFGMVDLVTRASLDDIKSFYTRSLTDLGFRVRDDGYDILTPEGAEYFGLAGTLIAERPGSSDQDYKYVAVQIRTEDGWLVRSRSLTVQWRKTVPDMTPR